MGGPNSILVMENDFQPSGRVRALTFQNCTVTITGSTAAIVCNATGGGSGLPLAANDTGYLYLAGSQTVTGAPVFVSSTVHFGNIVMNGTTLYILSGGISVSTGGVQQEGIFDFSASADFSGMIARIAKTTNGDTFVVWNNSVTIGPGQPIVAKHQIRASELFNGSGNNGTTGLAFGPGGAFGEQSGIRYNLVDDRLIFRTNGGRRFTLYNDGTGLDLTTVGGPVSVNGGGTQANPSFKMNVGAEDSGIYSGGDASILFAVQDMQIGGFEIPTKRLRVFTHIVTPYIQLSSATVGEFFLEIGTMTIIRGGERMQLIFPSSGTGITTNKMFQITPSSGIILTDIPVGAGSAPELPCTSCTINQIYTSSAFFQQSGSAYPQLGPAGPWVFKSTFSGTNISSFMFYDVPPAPICRDIEIVFNSSGVDTAGRFPIVQFNANTTGYAMKITSTTDASPFSTTLTTGAQGAGLNAEWGVYIWAGRPGIAANQQPIEFRLNVKNTDQSPKPGSWSASAPPIKPNLSATAASNDYQDNAVTGKFGYYFDQTYIRSVGIRLFGNPEAHKFVAPMGAVLKCTSY